MDPERYLVTGAAGCIGAWTVRVLLRGGFAVVAMDLSDDYRRLRAIVDPKELALVTIEKGDISDEAALARVMDQHEITDVIHLAALQIPFCRADPILGASVNVLGTVNVFEAVRQRRERIRGLAYASSVAVYGEPDLYSTSAVDEKAIPSPNSLYGVWKLANEGTAWVYWREHSVPSVGLRPYTVYGPGRDQGMTSAVTAAMEAAARGQPYRMAFGGRCVLNYAEDVARAFIAACRADGSSAPVCNVPGTVAHMAEVVRAIERTLPQAAGTITFEVPPLPFPEEFTWTGFDELVGQFQITPLEQGVRTTIEHYQRTDKAP
jgi:nucleoside-diphosphate-sugar epimerase